MSGKPRIAKIPLEFVAAPSDAIGLEDFYAYMPGHLYIFTPTREMWPAASVDSRLPAIPDVDDDGQPVMGAKGQKKLRASRWLDAHRAVEQMTWAPGEPMIICERLVADAGWIPREGSRCFNLYRPPTIVPGDPTKAGPWLEHVRLLYPDESEHILRWLAHRVQKPHEKVNHALVFGGKPGIGKDTILEPVAFALGPWNMGDIQAPALVGRFNGFVKCVLLRVSEARDLGDVDRYAFYERSKIYTAAPPDVLRVDEKNLREYAIQNVVGLVITTNHKTDGLYLPADDRRHFVAWSDLREEDFSETYFPWLYQWFAAGGNAHVAAWLRALDLGGFNPKAPPLKTPHFWAIVDASRTPEDAEMADALTTHGDPDAVTVAMLAESPTPSDFATWLTDRKNSRQIPHRLERCGYVATRSPTATDGMWVVDGKRRVIYAKAALPLPARFDAARHLADR